MKMSYAIKSQKETNEMKQEINVLRLFTTYLIIVSPINLRYHK